MFKLLVIFCLTVALFTFACVPYTQGEYDEPYVSEPYNAANDIKYDETGIASFTADEIQGKKTASGRIYNLRDLVAAHPNLPFGTIVEVTNVENNKSVQVEIIDRGPFVKGRIIDVSFAAAKELGFIEKGTTEVKLRVVRLGKQ